MQWKFVQVQKFQNGKRCTAKTVRVQQSKKSARDCNSPQMFDALLMQIGNNNKNLYSLWKWSNRE